MSQHQVLFFHRLITAAHHRACDQCSWLYSFLLQQSRFLAVCKRSLLPVNDLFALVLLERKYVGNDEHERHVAASVQPVEVCSFATCTFPSALEKTLLV